MTSLLDLKRRFVDVPTSAGDVRMNAVSVSAMAHLIGGFPLVKKLVEGKAKPSDFSVNAIVTTAPALAAELIAAGADHAGDAAYVKAAKEASIGDQVALLTGVMEASLPKGAAPFLSDLKKLALAFSGNGMKAPPSA